MKFLSLITLALVLSALAHDGHDHDSEDTEDYGLDHDDQNMDTGDLKDPNVHILDDTNFDTFIANHQLTLVKFYAPWCGHCKALAPEFVKAATTLASQTAENEIALADVDCTVHRDLCEKYEVSGFPTLKLFRNDGSEPTEYDQGRKADAIIKFMLRQKEPAYRTLTTKEEADKFAESDFGILAFTDASHSNASEEFIALAKLLRNEYDFALSSSPEVAQSFGITKLPSAIIFRKFDEPRVVFTATEFNAETISEFIIANSLPTFGQVGPENYAKYLERGLPMFWIFVDYDKEQTVLDTIKTVASGFEGKLSFVHLDGGRWGDHAKTFGLAGTTPGIAIEDRDTRKNFAYPADAPITVEAITQFVQDYLDKKLEPTLRSEPIPETNDGFVKILVGKTFDQIVMDPTKDVFVMLYAPWCGHCKKLHPKFEQLAEQLQNDSSIVIAQIDATENDVPVDIQGFPTLMLYPANDKQNPVTFDGDRTVEAMLSFVRETAFTLKGHHPSVSSSTAAAGTAATTHSHEDL